MNKKQGISLIVLVIIIIVMIILAGAIILTLNNSGIINEASEAVEGSNEAQLKNAVQLAWAEVYAEARAKGEQPTLKDLKDAVNATISSNKFDISEYGILVTTSGVKVVKGWVQDGTVVRRGTTELTIGSDFYYDEEPIANNIKDVAWKVLGASDDGELLILSNDAIDNISIYNDGPYEWVKLLDDLCATYGKGEYATGARSIKVEDVDKITGYDKTTYEKGTIIEYGNDLTYGWTQPGKIVYKDKYGRQGNIGSESFWVSRFAWYEDGKRMIDTENTTKEIITLKQTYYSYEVEEDPMNIAYTMLFGMVKEYFLSSWYLRSIGYGLHIVRGYKITEQEIEVFDGGDTFADYFTYGVRAVVSLAPNVGLIDKQV